MVAHFVRQSARPVLFVAMLTTLLLLLTMPAAAITWIDFQEAAGVLGQSVLDSNGTGGPTGSNFTGPRGIAVDPTTGKVFVVDTGHERVLRFSALAAVANGSPAEAVLGQPDFVSNVVTATQSGMAGPVGVAVDKFGTLLVADSPNNRVLTFINAAIMRTAPTRPLFSGSPILPPMPLTPHKMG